jgi:hypothetical protein
VRRFYFPNHGINASLDVEFILWSVFIRGGGDKNSGGAMFGLELLGFFSCRDTCAQEELIIGAAAILRNCIISCLPQPFLRRSLIHYITSAVAV